MAPKPAKASNELDARAAELGKVWWLVDAPMFIDRPLVEALHDALVFPEQQHLSRSTSNFKEVKKVFSGKAKASIGGKITLPEFLSWISPKLQAKASVEGNARRGSTNRQVEIVQGLQVENAERKLRELVLEYLSDFPERVLFVDVPGGNFSNFKGNVTQEQVTNLLEHPPRPLVFMDIAPSSAIYPTMAEMEGGGFKPIFLELDKKLFQGLNPMPKYPSDDKDNEGRKKYWSAVNQRFNSRTAMQELESACDSGRIGWIDFRVLFANKGDTSHLHIVPAGAYHAGVFGYNFVHRGYRYGCRIVGSLKSGNDMNVMAIYER